MCIFCDIANGVIPSHTIYKDESVICFLDVNPASYGHCLVVPKEHCNSFLGCPDEARNHVFEVAQKIANHLEQTLHCDGINIISNIHETAGQSVHHFHVHLIPRYTSGDQLTLEFGTIGDVDFKELLDQVKMIQSH